jgi:hypothetical protein
MSELELRGECYFTHLQQTSMRNASSSPRRSQPTRCCERPGFVYGDGKVNMYGEGTGIARGW